LGSRLAALAGFSLSIEIKPVVSADLEDELGGAERLPGTTLRVRFHMQMASPRFSVMAAVLAASLLSGSRSVTSVAE
jgi:hypothetical protein